MRGDTKSPAFQFYPRDWDTDMNVLPMTYEEEGVYWALIRLMWLHGSLPADLTALRRFLKGRPTRKRMERWWVHIGPCFEERDGVLTHPRLERERAKQQWARGEGERGGLAKWGGDTNPYGETRRQRMRAAQQRGSHTMFEWAEMLTAYKCCVRCGDDSEKTLKEIQKDHVVPVYQGGDDSIQNLQPLCRRCNSSKGPDSTDYRVGRPETQSRWIPTRTPTPSPAPSPADAYSSSASAFACTYDHDHSTLPKTATDENAAEKKGLWTRLLAIAHAVIEDTRRDDWGSEMKHRCIVQGLPYASPDDANNTPMYRRALLAAEALRVKRGQLQP